jgi:hypothetical protein
MVQTCTRAYVARFPVRALLGDVIQFHPYPDAVVRCITVAVWIG